MFIINVALLGCKHVAWRLPSCPPSRAFPHLSRNMSTCAAEGARPPSTRKTKAPRDTLRHVRSKENRRREDLHGPSTVHVQVVGAGSRDNGASLYVFSEYNRYLFNCGEGTQRLMQEHKLKAARLDNIFLTRMNWATIGGLSGMILTLKDTGVLQCVLSGPPQLEKYLNAIRVFSGSLDDIKLSVRAYTEPDYKDDTMTVSQVPLCAQDKDLGMKHGSSPSCSSTSSQRRELWHPEDCDESCIDTRATQPGAAVVRATRDSSLVVAFVCKLHAKKGNFLVHKAKELGLPVGTSAIGPIISALKDGRSVTYEGKEIQPSELCTPSDPGPVFLVVDCPSEEFVQPLCTNPVLRRYQEGGSEDSAALVVHMTPEALLKTEEYQRWMERFPSSTEHLVMNEQVCTVHNVRSYKIQTQLHMIHADIFPELQHYSTTESPAPLRVPCVRAECLLKFQLKPKAEWQRDSIPSCDKEEFATEAAKVPEFLQEVERCQQFQKTDAVVLSGKVEKYPEVVFLGTGSALPMKIRNVSGTLVNVSSTQSVLLDCGEGTFGQMCRHYGNGVDKALSKLSTVFVSHIHADHHTGLINLLFQRERALNTLGKAFTPVYLIAPTLIMTWLNQYHDHCQEILSHINFIPAKSLSEGADVPKFKTKSFIQAVMKRNDLTKMQTCLVRHCHNAFACSLTHHSGWQLVFSGDTMPCDALAEMGKNATLLIHEATLEDGMEEEAMDKRHSTTSQAINIGMKMGAEFIMLNHFSQRYAKIPLFSDDFNQRVGISFDHMRIRLGDFRVLPRLLVPLKVLFAEEIEEMEERRERRELRAGKALGAESNAEGGACTGKRGGAKREQEELNQLTASKRLKAV
ncbi:zinc phosphodiesterase ELAC protein 2 [Brachyhypopomus gauderio]|uniref:zinc phosphodiesterase ELAC protein 2 n=1 Tax=Brachyhypopomus gauderio TaxID=698409 RepID=UPI0040426449